MNTKNCERCRRSTNIFKMSFFNTDMLCMECLKKEESHPMYEAARKEELRQMKMGNCNFPGIGLPSDLK